MIKFDWFLQLSQNFKDIASILYNKVDKIIHLEENANSTSFETPKLLLTTRYLI